ncbi:MAG: hypothetical protein LKI39_04475 [Bacteroides sp.]|jgi:hypothetical protein|nr:hypothetical protein [Bacteroides sp.]MCI1681793.1 hypothetical protein [Bacteroides sp.]
MNIQKALGIVLLFFSAINLASCDKDDEIQIGQLTTGKWTIWNDDPNLAMDSSVDYTFNADGTCLLYTSSFLSDDSHTYELHYVVSIDNELLTIYKDDMHQRENEIGAGQFNIKKLTSKEMILESVDDRNENMKLRKF